MRKRHLDDFETPFRQNVNEVQLIAVDCSHTLGGPHWAFFVFAYLRLAIEAVAKMSSRAASS